MRSDGDLTARAAIRNAALELFAAKGPDAATVREIAAAAGVSPALVLHHFGSKAGLREAVDAHVAEALEHLLEVGGTRDVAADLARGDGRSLAAAFAELFPPGSPVPAYLRRLLLSSDPAGIALFRRWLAATEQLLDALGGLGLTAPSADPEVLAAFLLANDLAVVLLRDHIHDALGFDPLSPAGLRRWGDQVTSVYANGVWKGVTP